MTIQDKTTKMDSKFDHPPDDCSNKFTTSRSQRTRPNSLPKRLASLSRVSILLALVALQSLLPLGVQAAQKPKLAAITIDFIDTSEVSGKTGLNVDFTKLPDQNTWLDFYCFEMVFKAEYKTSVGKPLIYDSFKTDDPPRCIGNGDFEMDCKIKPGTTGTLQFTFSQYTNRAEVVNNMHFSISNFYNPYSSVVVQSTVIWNTDATCKVGRDQMYGTPLQTSAAQMLDGTAILSSSSHIVGYSKDDNELIIKFIPAAPLAPTNEGVIFVKIPFWFNINSGAKSEYMFNENAINTCTSEMLGVKESDFRSGHLRILFDTVKEGFLSQKWITISCTGFKNPIYPAEWSGFKIKIYDYSTVGNDQFANAITLTGDIKFQADYFKAAIMPPENLDITIYDPRISANTTFIFDINVNTPLDVGCYIKLTVPDDMKYFTQKIGVRNIFKNQNLKYELNGQDYCDTSNPQGNTCIKYPVNNLDADAETFWIFEGCYDMNSLGAVPTGRLEYTSFTMPRSVTQSKPFKMEIFKDVLLTQKIASMPEGVFIDARRIIPGSILNAKMEAIIDTVQTETSIQVSFTTSNQLEQDSMIEVKLPPGLKVPPVGSQMDCLAIDTPDGDHVVQCEVYQEGGYIRVTDFMRFYGGGQTTEIDVKLQIPEITTQISAKQAGEWTVTSFLKQQGVFAVVDTVSVKESFTVKPGKVEAATDRAPLEVTEQITYGKDSIYKLAFTLEHMVPVGGILKVLIPSEMQINGLTPAFVGSCSSKTCKLNATEHTISYQVDVEYPKESRVVLEIGGVINPRSFAPTQPFVITTLDVDLKSEIDVGFQKSAKMNEAGIIESAVFTADNYINGAIAIYTFTFTVGIPIETGDKIQLEFPTQIKPPTKATVLDCKAILNLEEVSCELVGTQVIVTVNKVNPLPNGGTFKVTLGGVKNSYSLKTTDGFNGISIVSSTNFMIADFDGKSTAGITNLYPAELVKYTAVPEDNSFEKVTNLKIEFTLVNALPPSASIQVTYPPEIILPDGANSHCWVKASNSPTADEPACVMDINTRTIYIKSAFGKDPLTFYHGDIIIHIDKIQNPKTNIARGFYTISTYADLDMVYLVDNLPTGKMQLDLKCNWPCMECPLSDKDFCSACWRFENDPAYPTYLFQSFDGQTPTCMGECPAKYSSNATYTKDVGRECMPCDNSCQDCYDTSIYNCTECNAPDYNFRYKPLFWCKKECGFGWYQYSDDTCLDCVDPCQDCSSETCCTKCYANSDLPVRLGCKCLSECPPGYTNVDGDCLPCEKPCQECDGGVNMCTSCAAPAILLYDHDCFFTCPAGTVPNYETSLCVPCLGDGCDLCKLDDREICISCNNETVLFEGKCISTCPNGMVEDYETHACREWQLSDLGVIYFPFLICASIFICVVLFGKSRRKAVLVKGKIQMHSYQSSIPAILAFLGPIQMFAVMTQWILAIVYNTMLHTILAMIVTVIILVISLCNVIMFNKKFLSYQLTREAKDKVKRGRITSKEAWKVSQNTELKDPRFRAWQKRHTYVYWSIAITSGLLFWKLNKLLYSRLYNYGNYTAYWQQAKEYRNFVYYYSLVTMVCVDLFLICISIPGLIEIEWGNQLYITMVETCTLSIINIILGSWELYKLADYLKYTTTSEKKWNTSMRVQSGYDSDDEPHSMDRQGRERTMRRLIHQVKHNKETHLNNRLDDLVNEFGRRQYKSCIIFDMHLQQEKVQDPRGTITWPITPKTMERYELVNIKHNMNDRYGLQDNCYYESVVPVPFKDKCTSGDAGEIEFQDCLDKKTAGLMSQRAVGSTVNEKLQFSKGKRRGRKNTYYDKIDQEDDDEVDAIEEGIMTQRANDARFKKEQEEEEEDMKQHLASQQAKRANDAESKRQQLQDAAELKMSARKAQNDAEDEADQQDRKDKKKREKEEAVKEAQLEVVRQEMNDEANAILASQEQREKEAHGQLEQKSELARLKYEAEEAGRLKEKADQKAKEYAAKMEEEAELAQAQKEAKEAALKALKDQQERKDKQGLAENLQEQDKKDHERLMEKLADADAKDQKRQDRLAKEKVEREAEIAAQEEQEATEKAEREATRAQESARRETEKEEKKAAEKAFKDANNESKGFELKPCSEKGSNKSDNSKTSQKVALNGKRRSITVDPSSPNSQKEDSQNNAGGRGNNDSQIVLNGDDLDKFNPKKPIIEVPPNAAHRNFSEQDILGDIERDENGNVLIPNKKDKFGNPVDKQGRPINQKGYLIDPKTGDIIDNIKGRVMFPAKDIDPNTGELPAPFNLEKFNFDPQNMSGDFDYTNGQPRMLKTNKGFCIDKQGRKVNKQGWLEPSTGSPGGVGPKPLVEENGRPKFDKKLLTGDGELPKLFNLKGKKFDVRDVMGQFDKDPEGKIIVPASDNNSTIDNKNGTLPETDNLGRKVNEKGFLVNVNGDIVDCDGKVLFPKESLSDNGDFPKIFPFTKFNPEKVTGEFDRDPSGVPILNHGKEKGQPCLKDKDGRPVNPAGYLIDPKTGDVVDKRGNTVFPKGMLDGSDGQIPAVFRNGQLKTRSGDSQISHLSGDIARSQPSRPGHDESRGDRNLNSIGADHARDYNTSVDSRMDDTPANYNMANQRMDDTVDENDESLNQIDESEEQGEHMAPSSHGQKKDPRGAKADPRSMPQLKRKKQKKELPKNTTVVEFMQPTKRDKVMADAYGGQPRGVVRKPGVKYEKERLTGSKKFVVSQAEEPLVRAELERLAKSVSGFNPKMPPGTSVPLVKRNGLMSPRNGENRGRTAQPDGSNGSDPSDAPNSKSPRRRADSQENPMQQIRNKGFVKPPGADEPITQGDFKRIFGKGIDQFLEDSEWDKSQDQVSDPRHQMSQQDPPNKLKAMEGVYLKKLDRQNPNTVQPSPKPQTSSRATGAASQPPGMTRGRDESTSKMRRSHQDSFAGNLRKKGSPKPARQIMKPEPGPPRETIISFTDDPGVIHRGEILPFHILKKNENFHTKGPHAPAIGQDSLSKSRSASPDRKSWEQR